MKFNMAAAYYKIDLLIPQEQQREGGNDE